MAINWERLTQSILVEMWVNIWKFWIFNCRSNFYEKSERQSKAFTRNRFIECNRPCWNISEMLRYGDEFYLFIYFLLLFVDFHYSNDGKSFVCVQTIAVSHLIIFWGGGGLFLILIPPATDIHSCIDPSSFDVHPTADVRTWPGQNRNKRP